MKPIVFLYAGNNTSYAYNKSFNNKSAFDLTLEWAASLDDIGGIFVGTTFESRKYIENQLPEGVKAVEVASENIKALLKAMAETAREHKADTVIYSTADRPFLDKKLTSKVLEYHDKYIAEYTFADGYPYGLAPETIDAGTLDILSEMAEENPVCNDSIFNVMRKDINSFEVETVIAPKDFRYLRLDFSCGNRRNYLSCLNLFSEAMEQKAGLDALSLSNLAEESQKVQSTVPSFYNIQISARYASKPFFNPYREDASINDMYIEDFCIILKKIKDFSDTAVISLSAWGEPLLNGKLDDFIAETLKYEGFSLLIETDGTLLTEERAARISEVCGKKKDLITWIVYLDAFSDEMYRKIRNGKGDFTKARESVSILNRYFTGHVYPQMTRILENECELEAFYRFYHDKASPSMGNVIIQKYDSFCGLLPDRKPADLSPINRYPCWHLKRDLTVLSNGDVPFCRECLDGQIQGNAVKDEIGEIWKKMQDKTGEHIKKNYGEKCRNCDEFYTFNF